MLDRLIQQALHQVLSPLFDPEFSEHSYGFRPGRSAHQAVLRARDYQREGKRWVVDMDLAQFFDEVNHDILMARVGRKVKDRAGQGVDPPLPARRACCWEAWCRCQQRARRRAARCHHCCRILCWMIWTRSWNGEGTASAGTRTTAISMLASRRSGERVMEIDYAFCRAAAEAEGQPGKERGGPSVASQVSRLLVQLAHQDPYPCGKAVD